MGSSKKKKEKREKKKHKRERSREREGHHRSHKSSQRERRHSRDRGQDESYADKRRYDEARYSKDDSDSQAKFTQSQFAQSSSRTEISGDEQYVAPAAYEVEEEEFDIDELLDSKLSENPEFSSKRHGSSKKFSAQDIIRNVERITAKESKTAKESFSEPFKTRYDNYVPGLDLVNEGRPDEDHGKDEDSFLHMSDVKSDYKEVSSHIRMQESYNSSVNDDLDEGEIEEPAGQAHLSLSISETNKLRAKLGLKPLDVGDQIPGLGDDSEEKPTTEAKEEVFVKTENIREIQKAEKLKEKIKTQKEKRKIAEKFREVKTLGASDSEEESAAAWVKKSRKMQLEREQAEKTAKLLEELDEEFGVGALVEEEFKVKKKESYTSKDLKGLKVIHDSSMIKEGQQVILTLKDQGVLDGEDDVLQNVNLVDEERYIRNVENKKKKPLYQPYDEEYDEFGILKKKTMLSKYDEEIEGQKKKDFVLGESLSGPSREKELELIRMKLNQQQQKVTLEMPNLRLASEYYTPDDMVQFKKPKKKKKKILRKFKADDIVPDPAENLARDLGSRNRKRNELTGDVSTPNVEPAEDQEDMEIDDSIDYDTPLIEDYSSAVMDEEDQAEKELYSALNKARRLKERKIAEAPEKVVVDVLKKAETTDVTSKSAKTGPIVLNSIAEFCRTLGEIPTYGMSGNRDEDADELMEFERELMEERQRQEMEAQNRSAWNEVNLDEEPNEVMIRENEPILEEEPNISLGVAGALHLAQKKGYLDKDMNKLFSGPRDSSLQAQSYTIEEKFYEDDKFGKRDRYTGPIQDFREKSSYKPDVTLEYINDDGRLLNAKEAFRYLSHKFHGKGPGKNKVDKRMKKLSQDNKLKQMSSTDTPLNTVKLLQAKQKEAQSPYIVLSGGSKTLTQTMISKSKHP